MATIHVLDIHDFLKAELSADSGCLAAGVRVSHLRIQRFLSGVKAGDQVLFVTPMHGKKFMHRLSASNFGEERVYLSAIDPLSIYEQLHHIKRYSAANFFPLASSVGVLSFNQLSRDKEYITTNLPNYHADPVSGSVFEAPVESAKITADDHVRFYSSDERFAASLDNCFKEAGSRSQASLAAAGQLWPEHKTELLRDIRERRVACVLSDMDETFLLTGLTAVVETNLCHDCDRVYLQLKKSIPGISGYPRTGSSQQRFTYLKQQLHLNYNQGRGRISEEAFSVLHSALVNLQSQELYGAHLDAWFNDLSSQTDILPLDDIQKMRKAYIGFVELEKRDGCYGAREIELRYMLHAWINNDTHPDAIKALGREYLSKLDEITSRLYFKRIVSQDGLECLQKAERGGSETRFYTSRPAPTGLAAFETLSIGSTVSNLSRDEVRKPSKQLDKMSKSASYLDSRRHNCHKNGEAGEILGPVHYSTKMMYHTIRMILSGKKYDQAETQFCWLMDDNPFETHPELVRQCNALFALQGMNLRWKVAVPCKGGEYLLAASPRPELASYEADKSAAMCEHCLPSKLLSLISTRYALLGGGADIDESLFKEAYDHAWHQVSLTRSLPLVAAAPASGVTAQSVKSMDKALAEIVARRAQRVPATVAPTEAIKSTQELPVVEPGTRVIRTVRVSDDLSDLFTPMPPADGKGVSLEDLDDDEEGLDPAAMAARVEAYLTGPSKH
ncbi:MAG: hypothetical protein P1U34_01230 [Coxiellaceae bacterium]|nr:hypothetical protein [Coxiellaceae bacterium]